MSTWIQLLLVVPLTTAFVGWITNWLAIKMIFQPERFIGIGPIGWQGIVPRYREKFAAGAAALAEGRLLSSAEVAQRILEIDFASLLAAVLEDHGESAAREVAEDVQPGVWDRLAPSTRATILAQIGLEARRAIDHVVDDMERVAHEFIDLKRLTVEALTPDYGRPLTRLIKKFGAKELRFIIYYGGVFGLFLGFIEAGLWNQLQQGWLLPVVGGVVGMVTNWLALQMVFRPLEPTRYFGLITYQGLFPARQHEIAEAYAQILSSEVLTPAGLIRLLSSCEQQERLMALAEATISKHVDELVERFGPLLPEPPAPEQVRILKKKILDVMFGRIGRVIPLVEEALESRLDFASEVEDRMRSLSKQEFEGILRGVFKEDESTLILLGGILGALIGLGQMFVMD